MPQDAPPAPSIEVWKKGVCSDTFHPRFRSQAMRERLSGGNPEAPILLSVGRLGNEKNLKFLKAWGCRHIANCVLYCLKQCSRLG